MFYLYVMHASAILYGMYVGGNGRRVHIIFMIIGLLAVVVYLHSRGSFSDRNQTYITILLMQMNQTD
jgi:hypothetical protein